ncbi:MAG TPA: molybdenum hydroxylase [Lachnospiraceae bacterium]|nr:molybdenum hydroxylase [Lachnospiraceae bacterium]
MTVLIKGAGDMASGIAVRLFRSGMRVIMTELPHPTAIRRSVAFSEAVMNKSQTVEGITGRLAENAEEALLMLKEGVIPVMVDPECKSLPLILPDVLVDAILAKRNLGTGITDAGTVIGIGPGFNAGLDCHAVVETMRGHTLGRVLYEGTALPDTKIPGLIGGFSGERIIRAPADGSFKGLHRIGDMVGEGEIVGTVDGIPVKTSIAGVLRGLIADGVFVTKGMKSGDVDPRGRAEYCGMVSDKALSVAGGVLEAILCLNRQIRLQTLG